MTQAEGQQLIDKIVGQIFGFQNPLTMEQFMTKFTFDIKLPQPVIDSTDGTTTWAQSTNPTRFVTMTNARTLEIGDASPKTDFMRPKRKLESVADILTAWNEINYTTTERYKESLNVSESDHIERSENVFRSQDVHGSKNVIFSDGVFDSEYMAACQRTGRSTYCIRVDDSAVCSNSFNVSWSINISNCFFMHDTADMQNSMFCTNMKGKQYCVANMQYTEEEYKAILGVVAKWILTT
jgi:hypothetical protein